jgi:ketosteroid isomerase-like protein
MRILLFVTLMVCLAFAFCAPPPEPEPEPEAAPEPVFDQAAEEAAIRKANEERTAVYNVRDANAYMAFFDEDCTTGWTSGPCLADIKESGDFPEQSSDAQAQILEQGDVAFITPEVAILRDSWEGSGALDENGEPLPPRSNQRASVFVKKQGKWLIAARFNRPIEEE